MGAPTGGFDTSKVWSPAGGWFPDPKAWKRNTFFGFVAAGVAAAVVFNYSRSVEVSPNHPTIIHHQPQWLPLPLLHSIPFPFPYGIPYTVASIPAYNLFLIICRRARFDSVRLTHHHDSLSLSLLPPTTSSSWLGLAWLGVRSNGPWRPLVPSRAKSGARTFPRPRRRE